MVCITIFHSHPRVNLRKLTLSCSFFSPFYRALASFPPARTLTPRLDKPSYKERLPKVAVSNRRSPCYSTSKLNLCVKQVLEFPPTLKIPARRRSAVQNNCSYAAALLKTNAVHAFDICSMSLVENACSQFFPSNCFISTVFTVPSSRQCTVTATPSGFDRGI